MKNTYAIKFYCRESKANKNGFAKVEASININQKRCFINLPYEAKPSEFNGKRQPQEIQQFIALMRVRINEIINDMVAKCEPVTATALREHLRCGGYKSYTIGDCFTDYLAIKKKEIGFGITKNTYRKYELTRDLFYEKFDKDADIKSLSPANIQDYYADLCKRYQVNSAASYINKTKTILKFAQDNGKLSINPFQGLKVKREKKQIEYLTEEELETIRNKEYSTEALKRVADVFLVQAYSGLSFVDLQKLRKEDIVTLDDGTTYIRKPRHKTGVEFTAVIFPQGVEILKKYDYHLPIISNQKTNSGLKAMARECGIDKRVYDHLGRKTYGTMLINRGLSMDMVAKALGHTQSRTTATYYASLHKDTIVNTIASAINK